MLYIQVRLPLNSSSLPSTKRFFLPVFPSFSLFSPHPHYNFVLSVSCSVETHFASLMRSSPSETADEGKITRGKREKKKEKSRLQMLSSGTLRTLYSTQLSCTDRAKTPLALLTLKPQVTSSRRLLSRYCSFNNTLSSPVRPRE